MNDEYLVERGVRAQETLTNPTIGLVVDELVKMITDTILGSSPEDAQARERAYYAYQGVKDIVGLLNQWVAVKDQIIAANKANEDNEGN